jgi:hypothetical protein
MTMPEQTFARDVIEDAADAALEAGTEEGIDRVGEVVAGRATRAAPEHLGLGDARWPNDPANAPDTWHLPPELAEAEFELSAAVVEALIAAGSFRPDTSTNGRLVLSLRGCALASGEGSVVDAEKVRLRAVKPDHEQFRCLIGLFDSDSRRISLYLGSTVPRRTGMLKFYNRENFGADGQNCNMLPTGCWELCVGTHGGTAGPVPFVLRLGDGPTAADAGPATVIRTRNDLIYGTQDLWDKTTPADNVHPAFLSQSFSSLGCLTVRGGQTPGGAASTAHGEWKAFRRKLGFDQANHGRRFDNLLVTGHEAAAVAAGAPGIETLRQGSQGPKVRRLQEELGLDGPDGSFGANTAFAFAKLQQAKLGFATGIQSARMAGLLGLSLGDGGAPAPTA